MELKNHNKGNSDSKKLEYTMTDCQLYCNLASCNVWACAAAAVWYEMPGKGPAVALCNVGVCGSAAYVYGI